MNELKPCPFCGGRAISKVDHNYASERFTYFVTCAICGIETKRDYRTKYHAIEAWNMRVQNE